LEEFKMYATRIKFWLKRFFLLFLNPHHKFANESYSQEGEDLIIKRYFEGKTNSLFYIDIGAHHPYRFSNTAIFYENGSNGINIEPNKTLFQNFQSLRLRDININVGVGSKANKLKFYEFDESALSTFNEEVYKERINEGWRLANITDIQVLRLDEILKSLKIESQIDFINIDVEGFDLEVLESNNWELFRPTLIVVEIYNFSVNSFSPIHEFLKSVDYQFFAKTVNTVFFKNLRE